MILEFAANVTEFAHNALRLLLLEVRRFFFAALNPVSEMSD